MLTAARSLTNNVSRVNKSSPITRQIHSSLMQRSAAAASHPATTAAASSHHVSSHDSHGHHAEEKEEYNEMTGWFLGEKPGYKGDKLPGGTSRQLSRLFLLGYGISLAACVYVINYKPVTSPTVWAKEYVLNVEKFKVPKVADFPSEPAKTD